MDRLTDRQTELPYLVQHLQCEHCLALRRAVKNWLMRCWRGCLSGVR